MQVQRREVHVTHKPREELDPETHRFIADKRGVVRKFDGPYGFIVDDSGGEYFVHYSAIKSVGLRNLARGQHVEFKAYEGPKGLCALEVRVLNY